MSRVRALVKLRFAMTRKRLQWALRHELPLIGAVRMPGSPIRSQRSSIAGAASGLFDILDSFTLDE